ncbi:MAG: MFS transporter [Gammaproteobacteria bacterium]|nr:MAG: MFS transporter [Gammaproteobacteria bacterium]
MNKLPATVVLLGSVSFLNDVASDMITPLLPVFLAGTLGAGPAIIGLIEGVADTAVSLLKLWAGRMSDRGMGRKLLTVSGYSVSNLVRPLLGLANSWGMVLLLRFTDRIGKGLRSAPRDAWLSGSIDGSLRGHAFGLHRTMDHSGAVIGPLLAAILLAWGLEMREVFLVSVVPGVLAVALLVFGLRAPARTERQHAPPLRWSLLHPRLRALVLAAGGVALSGAPDVFLILWLSQQGVPVPWIPLIWVAAHLARALIAFPAGRLSDRIGRLPVLISGWSLQVALLLLIPWTNEFWMVVAVLVGYAAATASTEGAELAMIGDLAHASAKGTAFGLYHMTVGLFALPGALWFGVVWEVYGMGYAFTISALLTAVAALALALLSRRPLPA